jgi:hypothetical protein
MPEPSKFDHEGWVWIPPRSLIRSRWMRADWFERKTGPAFRFHLVLDRSPALWLKIGRLDAAFHRYV